MSTNYFKFRPVNVLLISISLALGACATPHRGNMAADQRAIRNNKGSIDQFWHVFQSALKQQDLNTLASLTCFPLSTDWNHKTVGPRQFKDESDKFFPKMRSKMHPQSFKRFSFIQDSGWA